MTVEALVTENMGLAKHFALKYSNLRMELDDRISVCYIGLVKAAQTFDPDKGCSFATWASKHMTNSMLTEWRKEHSVTRRANLLAVSIDEPTYEDGPDLSETIGREDIMLALVDHFDQLSAIPEKALKARYMYYQGYTQREIADYLGVTQPTVSRYRQDKRRDRVH